MVGVIAYWNDHPWIVADVGGPKRWLSFYIFTLEAFGGTALTVIGGPEISHGYSIQHTRVASIENALGLYPSAKQVVLVGSGGVPLHSYTHPEEAVYIVGDDYGTMDPTAFPDADLVTIENPGAVSQLWSHNCIAIALYDRNVKSGGN